MEIVKIISKKKKLSRLVSLLFILVLPLAWLRAGPSIIDDNRVTDPGTSPALGRGYSLATNTFQSLCLTGVVLTEPSYDFTYTFRSVEIEQIIADASTNTRFRDYLIDKQQANAERKTTTTTSTAGKNTFYRHNVMAEIDLFSYYASVDEAQTRMSSSAAQLLADRDLPGFFSSCGSYYIRSIGRKAKFISLFEYQTRTRERDLEFEGQLENQIRKFNVLTREQARVSAATGADTPLDRTDIVEIKANIAFSKKANSKNLTITVSAFGLGKNEKASLISYDLDSFKQAIKDAFISMQNTRTGRVSSIEIVPWVENTDFQTLIKLEEEDVFEKTPAEEKAPTKPDKKLLYEKKLIMNLNAEFLSELERTDRTMMNLYYKSKLCRDYIKTNYKENKGSGGVFGNGEETLRESFKSAKVVPNRGRKLLALSKLDRYLSGDKVDNLLQAEKEFMYGKDSGDESTKSKGAVACMKDILRFGIYRVRYHDIPTCVNMIGQIAQANDETVDRYCLPSRLQGVKP